MMMRVAIYARYSSDRQNDRSIEDQFALCEQHARRQSFEIVARFEDRALSAATTIGRLGLQRCLREAKARRFDILLVEDVERLSRDQADLHQMRKELAFVGVAIHTVADGAIDALRAGVKGMLGEIFLKDLAAKTHRGLDGVIRSGRAAGGRSFGYRPVAGKPGELEIVEAEAQTVLRIFREYVGGATPRAIAARLNQEGAPGPHGGAWNASTINGSRIRANGVICNSLYRGEIVWNRQKFIKDPSTGKRVSRPNPRTEWRVVDAPHLRILDEETWRRAQAIKAGKGGERPHQAKAPRHLFSGLLKCGSCGSGYIVSGGTPQGPRIACSAARERGDCDNNRTLRLGRVEDQIIAGLKRRIASPEAVRAYVAEYQRRWRENKEQRAAAIAPLDKERRALRLKAERLVDAIADGRSSPLVLERLREAEERLKAIDAELLEAAPQSLPALLPGAAELYQRRLENLREALSKADDEARREIVDSVRRLIDKIVIHPIEGSKDVDLDVHGSLAAFLAEDEKKSPRLEGVGMVVAGARNSHSHTVVAVSFTVRLKS